MKIKKLVVSFTTLFVLSSCGAVSQMPESEEAIISYKTKAGTVLKSIPAPERKVVLSVYKFSDLTGQHKPNDSFSEYSRAVTQGGVSLLTNSLLKASSGKWFTVAERGGLQNLLQERKLIRAMRDQYTKADGTKLANVPPLLYAGILLEGGITAYESNVITGGLGARYLGIGGSSQYRRDIVTVHLRAISVQTGEVLLSIDTVKTIYSSSVSANVFKFVAFDKLLEIDTGFTSNEPPQLAVRQAIETAVYSLIMEGKEKGLWNFADKAKGKASFKEYLARRDGIEEEKPKEEVIIKTNYNKNTAVAPVAKPKMAKKKASKAAVSKKVVQKDEAKKKGKVVVKTNFNKTN